MQTQGRRSFKKFTRLLDDVKGARFHGPNRGRMPAAQQHGHFAEDQTGLGSGGYAHVILQNFDRAFDQKIEAFRRLTLPDDQLAGLKASDFVAVKGFKYRRHHGRTVAGGEGTGKFFWQNGLGGADRKYLLLVWEKAASVC
jgi:hypothetical protein